MTHQRMKLGRRGYKVQGTNSHLSQFPDLLREPPHGGVAHVPRVLDGHAINERVYLTGELAHDSEGGHVQGDSRTLLHFCFVDLWRGVMCEERCVRRDVSGEM